MQNLRSYEPTHKEYVTQPSHAPFNSSTERRIGENELDARKFNPGPGIYDNDIGFDSINKKKQSLMGLLLEKIKGNKAPFDS